MFTIHNGLGGHAARTQWQPTKAVRLAALLGTITVASFAANALTIVADANLRRRSCEAADCPASGGEGAHQTATQPARGANAPAHFRF